MSNLGYLRSSVRTIAICACLLAVGVAAGAAASGAFSGKERKQIKKIARSEINKRAGSLAVESAAEADHAASADVATAAGNAGAVNGIDVRPLSISMAVGDPYEQAVTVGTTAVNVYCLGGGINVELYRGTGGNPPIVGMLSTQAQTGTYSPPSNASSALGATNQVAASVSIRESSGRVTRIQLEGFHKADAYGGPDDCFAQGTIERFG